MFIYKYFSEAVSLFMDMSFYIAIGLFFAGLLHIFFSKELVTKYIGKDNFGSVFKSSLLGVPLPLCSCGVVPTAMFFSKNGASKASVTSFLISTPQTGIDSIVATYGMMGPFMAIYRPISAFISGIAGGIFISKTDRKEINNEIETECCSDGHCSTNIENKQAVSFGTKIKQLFKYAYIEFFDDISVNFIIGILISALIAVIIPNNFFSNLNISSGLPAMLIMIAIGIPMYICSTSSIPIAITLIMKGFTPGAAFVFLFAGPVTNAASISILSKVLSKKTVALYIAITSVMAIFFGILLDTIAFNYPVIENTIMNNILHGPQEAGIFKILASIIFLGLIIRSLSSKLSNKNKHQHNHHNNDSDLLNITVEGMKCNHCSANVKTSLESIEGIDYVEVNLNNQNVTVKGSNVDINKVKNKIQKIGYEVVE